MHLRKNGFLSCLGICLAFFALTACQGPKVAKEFKKALADGTVVLDVAGASTNLSLNATLTNLTDGARSLAIPAGLVFSSSDEALQRLVVIQDQEISAEPGAKKEQSIYTCSIDYGKEMPLDDDVFTAGDFSYCRNADVMKLLAYLGTDEGKAGYDLAAQDSNNQAIVQSAIWLITAGVTQAKFFEDSLDWIITGQIFNSQDNGMIMALFSDEEAAAIKTAIEGGDNSFDPVGTLYRENLNEKEKLVARLVKVFGNEDTYKQIRTGLSTEILEGSKEERASVQGLLDKAGIKGTY